MSKAAKSILPELSILEIDEIRNKVNERLRTAFKLMGRRYNPRPLAHAEVRHCYEVIREHLERAEEKQQK